MIFKIDYLYYKIYNLIKIIKMRTSKKECIEKIIDYLKSPLDFSKGNELYSKKFYEYIFKEKGLRKCDINKMIKTKVDELYNQYLQETSFKISDLKQISKSGIISYSLFNQTDIKFIRKYNKNKLQHKNKFG